MIGLAAWIASFFLQAQPVPEAAAQKESERLIRDVFKDDYAKKAPAEREALAERMVTQARQSKSEAATCYVLYREAQDLYAQVGEVAKAMDTIDEWAAAFAIDPLAQKSSALATAGRLSKAPEEIIRVGSAELRLAADAALADQFDTAEKSVQTAAALAKKAQNPGLAARAQARSRELADQRSRFDKLKKSRETLAESPEDPTANFAVGQYLAVVKGLWVSGLPLLAKGSDAGYRSAAERDLSAPGEPLAQAAAADAWWDLAEKEMGASRENLRARALSWYEKSQAGLSGLVKTKVDKRTVDLRIERLLRGTWVDVADPKLYGRVQNPLEVSNARTPIQHMPPGTFDGLMVHVKIRQEGQFSVQYDPEHWDMEISTSPGWFTSRHLEKNSWKADASLQIHKKDEYVMAMLIADGENVFYLDGQETFRQKAASDHVVGVQFYAWIGPIQFDQIKLRKKD